MMNDGHTHYSLLRIITVLSVFVVLSFLYSFFQVRKYIEQN